MTQLESAAARLAVLGMRDALERLATITDNAQADLDLAGICAVNATNWACALDETLGASDSTYAHRRDADRDGQVLDGLRYVRDRHMHQLVISTTPIFRVTVLIEPEERGDVPNEPGIAWLPVDDISEPTDGRQNKPPYRRRRAVYEDLLQIRRLHVGLSVALAWLTGEAARHGVTLSPWQLPDFPD